MEALRLILSALTVATLFHVINATNANEDYVTLTSRSNAYVVLVQNRPRPHTSPTTFDFSFRTWDATGAIFHVFPDTGQGGPAPSTAPALVGFSLRRGRLLVTIDAATATQRRLRLGKGLSDDEWHRVTLTLDPRRRFVGVKLDRLPEDAATLSGQAVAQLRRSGGRVKVVIGKEGEENGKKEVILKEKRKNKNKEGENERKTKIPEKENKDGARNNDQSENEINRKLKNNHILGCVRFFSAMKVRVVRGGARVGAACSDGCGDSNLCGGGDGGGLCVNRYDSVTCDCFEAKFKGGQFCEFNSPPMTLSGFDHVELTARGGDSDAAAADAKSHASVTRVRFDFKTRVSSSLLFLAGGAIPAHNHLAVLLHAGVLRVDADFGDGVFVSASFGARRRLDDDTWHSVVLRHRHAHLEIELDGFRSLHGLDGRRRHFHFDPVVRFGGGAGDAGVAEIGGVVALNFVGCLRDVFFNDVNVAEALDDGAARRKTPSYCEAGFCREPEGACRTIESTPLSFRDGRAALELLVDAGSKSGGAVSLAFRTFWGSGILVAANVSASMMVELIVDRGDARMLLRTRKEENDEDDAVISDDIVAVAINDGAWHNVSLTLRRPLRLRIDGAVREVRFPPDDADFAKITPPTSSIFVGNDQHRRPGRGFVGCVANVVVNGVNIDPRTTTTRPTSTSHFNHGATLDGCPLVDHCHTFGHKCLQGGRCVSDWRRAECLCDGAAHAGRFCQFSKLARSCQELRARGHVTSGPYLIDVDGDDGAAPVQVTCKMEGDGDSGDEPIGVTVVPNNVPPGLWVRKASYGDKTASVDVVYADMSREMLERLVDASSRCQQHLFYECSDAPLLLGERTWFTGLDDRRIVSMGSPTEGACGCFDSLERCANIRVRCNCDADDGERGDPYHVTWTSDEGTLDSLDDIKLPVLGMTFERSEGVESRAKVTLGPLRCWGDRTMEADQGVTLRSPETRVAIPVAMDGRRGSRSISFKFRTFSPDGDLMELRSERGERVLKISVEKGLFVSFLLPSTKTLVRSHRILNDGDWQFVDARFRGGDALFRVNLASELVDSEGVEWIVGGRAIVGGFAGSVEALVVDGVSASLRNLTRDSRTVVKGDLMLGSVAGCRSSPCRNGKCVELWGDYRCECFDEFSIFGRNCEINLNDDAMTLTPSKKDIQPAVEYFNSASGHAPFDPFDASVTFAFRSFSAAALLLHARDKFDNFIQFHFERDSLFVTLNALVDSSNCPIEIRLESSRPLNDGRLQRVRLRRRRGRPEMTLRLNDDERRLVLARDKIMTFSADPFVNCDSTPTVMPKLDVSDPADRVRVSLGSATNSTLPPLIGCLSGLKFDDFQIPLENTARDGGSGAKPGCLAPCDGAPCANGGVCREKWSAFSCDCGKTGFAGPTCAEDNGAAFDGKSFVVQSVPKASSIRKKRQGVDDPLETLEVILRVDSSSAGERQSLLYAESSSTRRTHTDFLHVYLNEWTELWVEVQSGREGVRLKSIVDVLDGEHHQLRLTKKAREVSLEVDESERETRGNLRILKDLSVVLVGGLPLVHPTLRGFFNFTGCLSNVALDLRWRRTRLTPLKSALYDDRSPYGARSVGGVVKGRCIAAPAPIPLPPAPENYAYRNFRADLAAAVVLSDPEADYAAAAASAAVEESFLTSVGPGQVILGVVLCVIVVVLVGVVIALVKSVVARGRASREAEAEIRKISIHTAVRRTLRIDAERRPSRSGGIEAEKEEERVQEEEAGNGSRDMDDDNNNDKINDDNVHFPNNINNNNNNSSDENDDNPVAPFASSPAPPPIKPDTARGRRFLAPIFRWSREFRDSKDLEDFPDIFVAERTTKVKFAAEGEEEEEEEEEKVGERTPMLSEDSMIDDWEPERGDRRLLRGAFLGDELEDSFEADDDDDDDEDYPRFSDDPFRDEDPFGVDVYVNEAFQETTPPPPPHHPRALSMVVEDPEREEAEAAALEGEKVGEGRVEEEEEMEEEREEGARTLGRIEEGEEEEEEEDDDSVVAETTELLAEGSDSDGAGGFDGISE